MLIKCSGCSSSVDSHLEKCYRCGVPTSLSFTSARPIFNQKSREFIGKNISRTIRDEAYDEGYRASGSEQYRALLTRLIACADNGYDTVELHAIVEDARKAVSE